MTILHCDFTIKITELQNKQKTEIQNQIVYLCERRDSCSTFQKSKRQLHGAVGLTQGSSISGLQVNPVENIQVDGIFVLWRQVNLRKVS